MSTPHSSANLYLLDTHEDPGLDRYLTFLRDEVNTRLETLMPEPVGQRTRLHDAMGHGLMGPGKRVRPLLCVLICEAAGGRGRAFALDAGCAVEMVHAASLILDDLPCMDDAATRRGRPTTHRTYGDASAILASIGLLNRAYEVLAEHESTSDKVRTETVRVLTNAVGTDGLVAGQEIDLHKRAACQDVQHLEGLNWLKTGVLFSASAEIGAIAAGLDQNRVHAVKRFSRHVGLAFQIADDLIDQEGTLQSAGKDVGQDGDKPTLVSLMGNDAARHSCHRHLAKGREALAESKLDGAMLDRFVSCVFEHLMKG